MVEVAGGGISREREKRMGRDAGESGSACIGRKGEALRWSYDVDDGAGHLSAKARRMVERGGAVDREGGRRESRGGIRF